MIKTPTEVIETMQAALYSEREKNRTLTVAEPRTTPDVPPINTRTGRFSSESPAAPPTPKCKICKEPIRLSVSGVYWVHVSGAKTHYAEPIEQPEDSKLKTQLSEIRADLGLVQDATHERVITTIRAHRTDAAKYGETVIGFKRIKAALEGV